MKFNAISTSGIMQPKAYKAFEAISEQVDPLKLNSSKPPPSFLTKALKTVQNDRDLALKTVEVETNSFAKKIGFPADSYDPVAGIQNSMERYFNYQKALPPAKQTSFAEDVSNIVHPSEDHINFEPIPEVVYTRVRTPVDRQTRTVEKKQMSLLRPQQKEWINSWLKHNGWDKHLCENLNPKSQISHYDYLLKALNQNELNVLDNYGGSFHWNPLLRSDELSSDSIGKNSDFSRSLNHMDSLFKKVKIPSDIITFRGIRNGEKYENLNVGDIITDKGLTSTSTDLNVALSENFTGSRLALDEKGSAFGNDNGKLLIIKTPKGYPAVHMDPLGFDRSEAEVLLKRGTSLVLRDTDKARKILFLEVLQDTD